MANTVVEYSVPMRDGVKLYTSIQFPGDPDGKYPYLKVLPTTNERYGKEVLIDFSDYNIDLVRRGNKYFIPVQTVSDLFITGFQSNLLYNGKKQLRIELEREGFSDA